MKSDTRHYSKEVAGDHRNYYWRCSFDWTGGYLGIDQDARRVLLSPNQVSALLAFIKTMKAKP